MAGALQAPIAAESREVSEGLRDFIEIQPGAKTAEAEICLPTAGTALRPLATDSRNQIRRLRMRVVRNGKTVRLFLRSGTDWTARYHGIGETALSDRSLFDVGPSELHTIKPANRRSLR